MNAKQENPPQHGPRAGSLGILVLAGSLALGIAGCSSTPSRAPETIGQGPVQRDAPKPAPRGGGYYKDDGPGDDIPANLDNIPDAEPRHEPLHRFANRPYNVFGVNYVPATEHAPFRQRGVASWYGRRFHGNPTSSGEIYDMYAMTAAHPTLPIPSYVRVTHVGNGRSVVVRVNDRGPFHKGRIIDLSYAAAHRLGFVNAGSATVDVEVVRPEDGGSVATARALDAPLPSSAPSAAAVRDGLEATSLAPLAMPVAATSSGTAATVAAPAAGLAPPTAAFHPVAAPGPLPAKPATQASPGVFLQLGAFASQANAHDFAGRLRAQAAALADRLELLEDGGRYRLHLGPFSSSDEARAEADRLAALLNFRPFVVRR